VKPYDLRVPGGTRLYSITFWDAQGRVILHEDGLRPQAAMSRMNRPLRKGVVKAEARPQD